MQQQEFVSGAPSTRLTGIGNSLNGSWTVENPGSSR